MLSCGGALGSQESLKILKIIKVRTVENSNPSFSLLLQIMFQLNKFSFYVKNDSASVHSELFSLSLSLNVQSNLCKGSDHTEYKIV